MFDLHKLGWQRFQQLCLTVCREILGQTVQSFLDSNDGGRDGAFSGIWKRKTGEILSGEFVIQCKFTATANRHLRVSDVAEEIEKAKRLVQAGRCDTYLLMTNAGVSGPTAERIEKAFRQVGVKHMDAIDGWKALVLKLDDPQTVVDHWNPEEKSQFFWIDDAFGATQYDSTLA